MKRRTFIRLTLATIAGAIAAFFFFDNFHQLVKKIVKAGTTDLKVGEEEIDRFIADAKDDGKWDQFTPSMKLFIRTHYYFGSFLPIPYPEKFEQQRNFIVGNFLLSTDFFTNKMNVDLPLRYVALNHPYRRSCSNPFSNAFYDANAVLNARG